MFSINPRTGTFTLSNMVTALRASISATSCGVVTIMAPASATVCTIVSWMSPVPGGRSRMRKSSSPQSHLSQELLRVARDHRAPHDRRCVVIEKEAHGHELESVLFDWHNQLLLRRHRLLVGAKHQRDARAVEIAVAQADTRFRAIERYRQIGRHGDLPTPPLPLATAMTCFTPAMRRGTEIGRAGSARRRMHIDQDLRGAHTRQCSQDLFCLGFDRGRDVRIVARHRHLRANLSVLHRNFLDQTKGDNVPAITGILHRAQAFAHLLLRQPHRLS